MHQSMVSDGLHECSRWQQFRGRNRPPGQGFRPDDPARACMMQGLKMGNDFAAVQSVRQPCSRDRQDRPGLALRLGPPQDTQQEIPVDRHLSCHSGARYCTDDVECQAPGIVSDRMEYSWFAAADKDDGDIHFRQCQIIEEPHQLFADEIHIHKGRIRIEFLQFRQKLIRIADPLNAVKNSLLFATLLYPIRGHGIVCGNDHSFAMTGTIFWHQSIPSLFHSE